MTLPFPSNPNVGDNHNGFVWDGVRWACGGGAGGDGGVSVIVSETAPANPRVGTLWWDPSIGRLFVWDGGTGHEWVAVPWGGMTDAPDDGLSYGRRNSVWAAVPTIYAIGTGLIGGGTLEKETTYLRDRAMAFISVSINGVARQDGQWVYAQESGSIPAAVWLAEPLWTSFYTAPAGAAGEVINWQRPYTMGRNGTFTIPGGETSLGFNAQRSPTSNWEYAGPGYASVIQAAHGNLYILNAPEGSAAGQAIPFSGETVIGPDGGVTAPALMSTASDGYSIYAANGGIYANLVITAAAGLAAGGLGVQTSLGGADWFAFHWNGVDAYLNVNNLTGWMQLTGQSDERLKQDIAPTQFDCLAALLKIPVNEFRWRSRPDALVKAGLIAQQVQAVEPTLVTDPPAPVIPRPPAPEPPPRGLLEPHEPELREDRRPEFSPLGIDTNNMLAVLIGAVQQLSAQVEAQAARIAELEAAR